MKATAKRIGKSKNEQIIVNGKIYIKSCLIGKWNFLVITTSESSNTIETKHRDLNSAHNSMYNAVDSYAKYKKSQGEKVLAVHSVIEITRD